MYVSNDWKDYEVIDTSEGESLRDGEMLFCVALIRRLYGKALKNGKRLTAITTAVKTAAETGSFSEICPKDGQFLTKI